ncbi:hypothetical protein PN450_00810 [Dolichospermum lemmermannii CS-548]|uniref:hypothetical protein n=1 Tax=Dolichospermum lemmermannii TaxID=54295 RepID=UPI00232FED13|nr:hypothetical protein [Dolichospermum lemmermannii]MDB9435380.1 hypothetical protein [Dolichospermum lemmermannii CS-548]
MNATQLANVLQKVKTDPVLQETLRVTKQDWVELNLTTLESLQASMNITSAPEFSDEELEINGSCCGYRSNCGTSCVEFRSVQLVPVFNFVD